MKIYIVAPLFTQAERRWNLQFARELEQRGYRANGRTRSFAAITLERK